MKTIGGLGKGRKKRVSGQTVSQVLLPSRGCQAPKSADWQLQQTGNAQLVLVTEIPFLAFLHGFVTGT